MHILDTNTLIYYFKGMGNVAGKLLSIPPKDIGLPTIVLYELYVGIAKASGSEKRKIQLAQFVDTVNLLPFRQEEADYAATIRANLEARGCPIGPYDILIAATALANKGTLVTHNLKEFGRIEGLEIEDWY